jgi:hypothetical protein
MTGATLRSPGPRGRDAWLVAGFLAAMPLLGGTTALLPWRLEDVSGVALLAALLLASALWRRPGAAPGSWPSGRDVLLLALAWRGLAAIAQRLSPLSPVYTVDARVYEQESWEIARAWLSDAGPLVLLDASDSVLAYQTMMASVYVLVGRSVLTLQVLSALAGALAVYYAWRSARQLIGAERAGWLVVAIALWPSHVVWSSQSLRDPWVFLLLSRSVWSAVLWLEHGKAAEWAKALGFAALVAVFRLSTAIPLAVALLAMSAYVVWRALGWRGRLGLGVVTLAGLAVGGALGVSAAAGEIVAWLPGYLSAVRRGLATGGSAFLVDARYASWPEALAFLPLGAVYVLFAPFPWAAENAAQLASALENSLLCLLGAAALPRAGAVWRLWRTPAGAYVGLVVLLGVAFMALVEGNLGTAYRHKASLLPFLLVLAGAGWPVVAGGARRPAAPPGARPAAAAAP